MEPAGPLLEPIFNKPVTPLRISNIQDFPREILEIIFGHLPTDSLYPASLVCKKFSQIISKSRFVRYKWYIKKFRAFSDEIQESQIHSKEDKRDFFKHIMSQEKAVEKFVKRPEDEIIKKDATLEEIQLESERLKRAQEIHERSQARNCATRWRWVVLAVTCCGCCGTLCCLLCLYNKIVYDECSFAPPQLKQEDPNPLG